MLRRIDSACKMLWGLVSRQKYFMKIISYLMANEYEVYLEASTRGYHAYVKESTVYIGEILFCEMEPNNPTADLQLQSNMRRTRLLVMSLLNFLKSTSFYQRMEQLNRVPKGGLPEPRSRKIVSAKLSPIASLLGALILFCCRAWSPQNVCCGVRIPKY